MCVVGIYKITSPSGRIYIGQSVNIEKRWNKYDLLHCKGQRVLYNSLKKYGAEAHTFEIIKECEAEELNKWERFFQIFYNNCGYEMLNLRVQHAEGKSGTMSDESKIKMSEAGKVKIFSSEHRKKMREAKRGEKHPKYGKCKIIQQFDKQGNFIKSAQYDVFIKQGFHFSNISNVCNGYRKSHKGFIFKYANKVIPK